MTLKTTKTKRQSRTSNLSKGRKVKSGQRRGPRELGVVGEYAKYFAAPSATPQAFHILDMTDGSSVSTSYHT